MLARDPEKRLADIHAPALKADFGPELAGQREVASQLRLLFLRRKGPWGLSMFATIQEASIEAASRRV